MNLRGGWEGGRHTSDELEGLGLALVVRHLGVVMLKAEGRGSWGSRAVLSGD